MERSLNCLQSDRSVESTATQIRSQAPLCLGWARSAADPASRPMRPARTLPGGASLQAGNSLSVNARPVRANETASRIRRAAEVNRARCSRNGVTRTHFTARLHVRPPAPTSLPQCAQRFITDFVSGPLRRTSNPSSQQRSNRSRNQVS